ncbi:hypothetical protein O5O45_16390 [Hahella aquimaris]|uniref:hypothetical protein n=1 Tax=Hahella sp. HNIBRBA332 TaxID=3015983 RepID=UPI00273C7840|nr:hypothetical protein [Hahella sp. HNIBRBA332]WLQ11325.1 hypothetical protein O5O45_16390 [Hahella sp. HNIBRBA332]
MDLIQDVDFLTEKKLIFRIVILKKSNAFFVSLQEKKDLFEELFSVGESFYNAKDAFECAVKKLLAYIDGNNYVGEVIRVNNPCNCSLICLSDQKLILKHLKLNVLVEVNSG